MTAEEIYKNYHNKVENYIYGKVTDRYLAEDIVSAAFLKVYEKLDSFDASKASISTWVYTIANNTLIDYYRTRKVTEEVPEEISDMEELDADLLNEETLTELADALEKIPEREKDLLVLRYYDDLTLKEIAVKMGMSYANVKIIHGKALFHLRELMLL